MKTFIAITTNGLRQVVAKIIQPNLGRDCVETLGAKKFAVSDYGEFPNNTEHTCCFRH